MTKASDLGPSNVLENLAEEGADPLGMGRPFVERLAPSDWDALKECGRVARHLSGSIISHEGAAGDTLHVLLAGRVAVLKNQGDGQSALLAYRGPGDVLGEMGVMSGVPRSATVVAVEDTETLCVEGSDFRALIGAVPGICRTMLYVLSERLRAADIARTAVVQEERSLAQQLQVRTTETERLAELARLRQQTVDLIVHDLRSPLSVVRGCLDILEESLSEESLDASDEVLSIARSSLTRLLNLVEALLDAARRETLGVQLDLGPVDLVDLLEGVVSGFDATAASSGVDLSLAVPRGLPQPQADRGRLERVVANLVDNAISYTPSGGSIDVTATASQDTVTISVTDTGPGIPPEYREHIFERFSRVPGRKGRRRGTGLGLYYCRQTVQAHKGRIWVEPGPDQTGSRFAFSLPLGEPPHG